MEIHYMHTKVEFHGQLFLHTKKKPKQQVMEIQYMHTKVEFQSR